MAGKRATVTNLMQQSAVAAPAAVVAPDVPVRKDPRAGWQVAQFRFKPATWKSLRQIALDRDENVQILVEKALAYYLEAQGIKTARLELRKDEAAA